MVVSAVAAAEAKVWHCVQVVRLEGGLRAAVLGSSTVCWVITGKVMWTERKPCMNMH